MLVLLYRLMEHIDGERGMHLMSYSWATMIKLWLLERLDQAECLHERYVARLNPCVVSQRFSLRNAARLGKIYIVATMILFLLNATPPLVYALLKGECVENGKATFEHPDNLTHNVNASDKGEPVRDRGAKPRVLKGQPVTERRQK